MDRSKGCARMDNVCEADFKKEMYSVEDEKVLISGIETELEWIGKRIRTNALYGLGLGAMAFAMLVVFLELYQTESIVELACISMEFLSICTGMMAGMNHERPFTGYSDRHCKWRFDGRAYAELLDDIRDCLVVNRRELADSWFKVRFSFAMFLMGALMFMFRVLASK